jgi:hypothetical protein
MKKDYVLNIKVPFQAKDDFDANEHVKTIFSIETNSQVDVDVKLQEIFIDCEILVDKESNDCTDKLFIDWTNN